MCCFYTAVIGCFVQMACELYLFSGRIALLSGTPHPLVETANSEFQRTSVLSPCYRFCVMLKTITCNFFVFNFKIDKSMVDLRRNRSKCEKKHETCYTCVTSYALPYLNRKKSYVKWIVSFQRFPYFCTHLYSQRKIRH